MKQYTGQSASHVYDFNILTLTTPIYTHRDGETPTSNSSTWHQRNDSTPSTCSRPLEVSKYHVNSARAGQFRPSQQPDRQSLWSSWKYRHKSPVCECTPPQVLSLDPLTPFPPRRWARLTLTLAARRSEYKESMVVVQVKMLLESKEWRAMKARHPGRLATQGSGPVLRV
jgi:hypothetical protein